MNFQVKKNYKDKLIKGFKDPVYYHKEILQRDLHIEQEEVLRKLPYKDAYLSCGNRWGKGDLITGFGCWLCHYKPVPKKFRDKNIEILNLAPSQDQANIVFNKFEQNMVDIPSFSYMIKDITRSPFPKIKFRNNMEWHFRNSTQNGKYIEGHSYYYINFDEADLQNNYYKFITEILEPRVWDYGGFITSTSTPRKGKKNAYKIFDKLSKEEQQGNKDVLTFFGDSRKNKFLHKKAISKMNKLPPRLFNKNVLGLFEDSDGTITNNHVDYAESISIGLLDSPRPGFKYITGWDLARSSTYCCAATIEVNPDPEKPLQLVSFDRFSDHQNKDREYWQNTENKIKSRDKKWRGQTVIDKTGIGDVVFSYIEDINPIGIQLAQAGGRLREDIINEGISTIEMGMIGIPDIEKVQDNELWRIKDELTDFDKENLKVIIWDMVCAIFLAIWVARGNTFSTKPIKIVSPSIARVRGENKYGVL